MNSPLSVRAALALLVTTLVACQSPRARRIHEHGSLFATLAPRDQQIIREGLFDRGFTPEMVYMALGKPSRAAQTQTQDGTIQRWTYRNFVYGTSGAVRMSANLPGSKPYGPILSSSAPGGPSIFSTRPGPMQPTVSDGSDAPVATLHLDFLNGILVAARLEQ